MGDKRIKWYDRQRVDVTDMTDEQSYMTRRIGNIFARALGDGIINGLEVSDDSEMINQNSQNNYYDTHIDTIGNQIIQIFKATTNNLQKIIIHGRRTGAVAGNIDVSIYQLNDPTDMNSGVSGAIINQVTVPYTDFGTSFGEVTIDFTSTGIAEPGTLTVGNYYALILERDNSSGSIDISYKDGSPYADGFIIEYNFSTHTYTDRADRDLYFKIYADAIQVSAGNAYKQGNPIEVSSAQRKVNLVDTSGATNYVYIKYKEIETDPETHPRTGQQVNSRIEDNFEIVVKTSSTADSDEEPLAEVSHTGSYPLSVGDRRVFIPSRNSIWDNYTNKNVLLTGQSIQSGVNILDCVYYNNSNSRWEKASFTNLPQGVKTANGEVTLFGRKTGLTISGLTIGRLFMDLNGNLSNSQSGIQIGYMITSDTLLIDIDISRDSIVLYDIPVDTGVSVLDCVYLDSSTGKWKKASSSNFPQGVLTGSGEVALFGKNTGLSGLSIGTQYMDSSGNLTTTQTDVKIGFAPDTSTLLVDIDFIEDNSISNDKIQDFTIQIDKYHHLLENKGKWFDIDFQTNQIFKYDSLSPFTNITAILKNIINDNIAIFDRDGTLYIYNNPTVDDDFGTSVYNTTLTKTGIIQDAIMIKDSNNNYYYIYTDSHTTVGGICLRVIQLNSSGNIININYKTLTAPTSPAEQFYAWGLTEYAGYIYVTFAQNDSTNGWSVYKISIQDVITGNSAGWSSSPVFKAPTYAVLEYITVDPSTGIFYVLDEQGDKLYTFIDGGSNNSQPIPSGTTSVDNIKYFNGRIYFADNSNYIRSFKAFSSVSDTPIEIQYDVRYFGDSNHLINIFSIYEENNRVKFYGANSSLSNARFFYLNHPIDLNRKESDSGNKFNGVIINEKAYILGFENSYSDVDNMVLEINASSSPSGSEGDFYIDNQATPHLWKYRSGWIDTGTITSGDRFINLNNSTQNIFSWNGSSFVDQGIPTDKYGVTVLDTGFGNSADYVYNEDLSSWIRTDWNIVIEKTTIDLRKGLAGRIDGLNDYFPDSFYFVWAFADANNNFKGLGITRQPKAYADGVASTIDYTKKKNETLTITSISNFDSSMENFDNENPLSHFTVGATIQIWNNSNNFYIARIDSIILNSGVGIDDMTVTILYSSGGSLTGSDGTIVQLDNFKPYINGTTHTLYQPKFKLISKCVRINDEGNIKSFIWHNEQIFNCGVQSTFISAVSSGFFSTSEYFPPEVFEFLRVISSGVAGASISIQSFGLNDLSDMIASQQSDSAYAMNDSGNIMYDKYNLIWINSNNSNLISFVGYMDN